MLLALIAVQAMQSGIQNLTPRELALLTQHYASQWWCAEGVSRRKGELMQRPVPAEAPSPERVLSVKGNFNEADFLGAIFQPFWLPGGEKVDQHAIFRREISFPGELRACSVILSADDEYRLSVNGQQVMAGSDLVRNNREIPITDFLHGHPSNALEVDVHNQGGPAFLRCRIEAEVTLPVLDTQNTGWEYQVGDVWAPAHVVKSPVFSDTAWQAIWAADSSDGVQCYEFRRTLPIDGIPLSSQVLIGADDAWELWVNGKWAGYQGMRSSPARRRSVDISTLVHSGSNSVQVKVWNYGGPGALFCVPMIRYTF